MGIMGGLLMIGLAIALAIFSALGIVLWLEVISPANRRPVRRGARPTQPAANTASAQGRVGVRRALSYEAADCG